MSRSDGKIKIGLSWIVIVFVLLWLLISVPSTLDTTKTECYYSIIAQLFILFFAWVIISARRNVDFFEPIVFVSALHIMTFEITPLICLMTGDVDWFGLDLWRGCIKATWISTLGFLVLLGSYYYKHNTKDSIVDSFNKNANRGNLCIQINVIIWLIAFSANTILMLSSGRSFTYIMSLGSAGTYTSISTSSSIEFLGVLAYAMISSYLYIFAISRNRLLKSILFVLMAISFMARGFRFILIAVIIAPVILTYLKSGKRPRIIAVSLLLVVLMIMVGFVGSIRDSVRSGGGIANSNLGTLSFEKIIEMIADNFAIVKTYYGIVENIPDRFPYTMGQQIILYSLIMLIPRGIWPGKPQPVLRNVISAAVSEYAVTAGTAYPYIGEYYHEFGVFGVVIGCIVLGKFCSLLKRKMIQNDIHSLVEYATFYPLLFQILLRGYTPSNVYMLLAVALPIWITKHVDK